MRKTPRVLLVEDEESLLEAIRLNLEMEGYQVVTAETGPAALKAFSAGRFNLVILDVMLPEIDGFDVCRSIRLQDSDVPVLFLTAKNTSADRVHGLRIGGDDYLAKPFNLEEFLLRVEKLIQRSVQKASGSVKNEFNFGLNKVNFQTFVIVGKQGVSKRLSKLEMKLLTLLIERKEEVVSREQILKTVWGYDVYPTTRTIDNFILAFRRYFEDDPKQPRYFHSVRGVGYRFTP